MRDQPLLTKLLILAMCLVRFALAAYAWVDPPSLLAGLGAPPEANPQAPYIVRVWAIRDMVLAVLVIAARPQAIVPLLLGCIVIDSSDLLSAWLGDQAGLFARPDTIALSATAVAALGPEIVALGLIHRRQT